MQENIINTFGSPFSVWLISGLVILLVAWFGVRSKWYAKISKDDFKRNNSEKAESGLEDSEGSA